MSKVKQMWERVQEFFGTAQPSRSDFEVWIESQNPRDIVDLERLSRQYDQLTKAWSKSF